MQRLRAGAVSTLLAERPWSDDARCRRDDAVHFFSPLTFERKPEKDRREATARALCRTCPVQRACLEHALATDEPHGIWGGLNELQRSWRRRKDAAEQSVFRASLPTYL